MRYHVTFVRMAIISINQQTTSVGKDVEKRKPSCTLGGIVNWWSHYVKDVELPQKIKFRTTTWPSNFTSGYSQRKQKQ